MDVPGERERSASASTGGEPCRSPVVAGGRFRMMHRGILPPPAPLGSHQASPPAPLDRRRLDISTVWLRSSAGRSPSVFIGLSKPRASRARRCRSADRGKQSNARAICTAIDHARRSCRVTSNAAGTLDSKTGRVARLGKLGGSLETQAVAMCFDASCGNDRRRRPASDGLYQPRHLAPYSVPFFRSLLGPLARDARDVGALMHHGRIVIRKIRAGVRAERRGRLRLDRGLR